MATSALPLGFDPMASDGDAGQSPLSQVMSAAGRNAGDENLAWWGGFLKPNPNGSSGALSNAIQAQSTVRLEKDKLLAQYMPLIQQAMMQNFMTNALGGIYGSQQPTSPGAQQSVGGGAQQGADASPTMGGAQGAAGGMPASGAPAQGGAPTQGGPAPSPGGNSLYDRVMAGSYGQALQADAMTGGHYGFGNAWKMAHEGIEQHAGSYYKNPLTNETHYNVKYAEGMGPQGVAPGVVGGTAAIAGAKTGAEKLAENLNTPLDPSKFLGENGAPIGGTVAQYLGQQGVSTANPGALPKSQNAADTNPSIALSSELDKAYLRYQQAQASGDVQSQPALKKDVLDLANEMKRQNITYTPADKRAPLGAVTPQDIANAGGGDVGAVQRTASGTPQLQGPAAAAGQKTAAEQAATSGQKYQDALHEKVDADYALVQRNQQVAPLLDKYNSGGIAPEERLHVGNALANSSAAQSLFGKSNAKALGDAIAGGDVTAGKVLENQLVAAGLNNLLQTLNSGANGARPNRAEFEVMNEARESLKSGNATLKDVFELQNRLYKIHYNEQQAMTDAIKNGTYNPRTWAGDYSKVRNQDLGKPAAPLPSALPAGIAKVSNDADFEKLPSGAVFVGPDGKQRRKP